MPRCGPSSLVGNNYKHVWSRCLAGIVTDERRDAGAGENKPSLTKMKSLMPGILSKRADFADRGLMKLIGSVVKWACLLGEVGVMMISGETRVGGVERKNFTLNWLCFVCGSCEYCEFRNAWEVVWSRHAVVISALICGPCVRWFVSPVGEVVFLRFLVYGVGAGW